MNFFSNLRISSKLADAAGQAMQGIVAQVPQVTGLIGSISISISSASAEQTQGIAQVDQAVQQLDQVTQQNAALVEEGAAAAESLRHQASRLAEMVGRFKLAALQHQPGRGGVPTWVFRRADPSQPMTPHTARPPCHGGH